MIKFFFVVAAASVVGAEQIRLTAASGCTSSIGSDAQGVLSLKAPSQILLEANAAASRSSSNVTSVAIVGGLSADMLALNGADMSAALESLADASARQWSADETLVIYLRFDEQNDTAVAKDATAYENSAVSGSGQGIGEARVDIPAMCRGRRWVTGSYETLVIPSSDSIRVHKDESFSVAVWANYSDFTYPKTALGMKYGSGCYYGPQRPGAQASWEIGHGFGYNGKGIRVCLRDHEALSGPTVHGYLYLDNNSTFHDFIGQWVHYIFVIDREPGGPQEISWYVNGARQDGTISLLNATSGPLFHQGIDQTFNLGQLYGWQTDGAWDEFRFYKRALSDADARALFRYRPPRFVC